MIETAGDAIDLLALPDLVRAKQTQRDKDRPMIARLIEAHDRGRRNDPMPERIAFWLREARTPEPLHELARRFPDAAAKLAANRPLLRSVGDEATLRRELRDEEEAEKAIDREHWRPLRAMLE